MHSAQLALVETQTEEAPVHNPRLTPTPHVVHIADMHDRIVWLDPRRVMPMADNPRHANNPGFRPESIASLSECIVAESQTEPVLVCLPKEPGWDAALADGERRLRACLHGGIMIKARVDTSIVDPEEHFVKSVTANLHREGHTCIEIAHAIRRMQQTRTNEQIATIFGRSLPWVNQHISLLRLDESLYPYLVEQEVESVESDEDKLRKKRGRKPTGKLTFSLALTLSSVPKVEQLKLAEHVLSRRMPYDVARRYILGYMDQNQLNVHRRQRPPSELFEALESLTNTANNRFGVYIDKRPAELRALFETQPIQDRMVLADDLRMLASNMLSLADLMYRSEKKK